MTLLRERELEDLWNAHIQAHERRGIGPWGRAVSSHRFRSAIETTFSGSRLQGCLDSDRSSIAIVDALDEKVLLGLFRDHSVSAIHVKRFCSPEIAHRLSAVARREHAQWKLKGTIGTDMHYAGGSIPIEVATHSKPDFFRYFAEWHTFVDRQRAASIGAWPIDRLRLTLDDVWQHGARLGDFAGRKARPAMMRIMTPDNADAPNQGFIHVDGGTYPDPKHGNASANIYLEMPPSGGELQVWNVDVGSQQGPVQIMRSYYVRALLDKAFDVLSQKRLSACLPPPLTIRPEVGDLVIFHTGRPHAVRPARGGFRVTNQTFLEYTEKKPLVIWS